MCKQVCVHVPTVVHARAHTHINLHARSKHINTYIHTYIHTYTNTYIHTYIHTYIYTQMSSQGAALWLLLPALSSLSSEDSMAAVRASPCACTILYAPVRRVLLLLPLLPTCVLFCLFVCVSSLIWRVKDMTCKGFLLSASAREAAATSSCCLALGIIDMSERIVFGTYSNVWMILTRFRNDSCVLLYVCFVYVCVCACMYVLMYVLCICIYAYICTCMYVCTYVYMYACMYV
jgi:hypothetical protein